MMMTMVIMMVGPGQLKNTNTNTDDNRYSGQQVDQFQYCFDLLGENTAATGKGNPDKYEEEGLLLCTDLPKNLEFKLQWTAYLSKNLILKYVHNLELEKYWYSSFWAP